MPIYEYKCDNGHVFDVMQKMSEDPLTECVECGAPVRKVLQPVGISFKGSGFYSTDYSGRSKTESTTKSDSSNSSDSNGTSDKSTKNGSGDSKSGDSAKKPDSSSSSSTSKKD